jgi:hypothetical protein
MRPYPDAQDPSLVGTYPAAVAAGGGYVWDAVLEYRVWCHPHAGAPDLAEGNDYFYAFAQYEEARQYFAEHDGTEEPLALVLQQEYIAEEEPGEFVHVQEPRLTEWPVEFLSRPARTAATLPAFFAPDAPSNRVAILRGLT